MALIFADVISDAALAAVEITSAPIRKYLRHQRLNLFQVYSGDTDTGKGRRGKESNLPRPGKRADSGFEDRGDHQAPITLHENKEARS